MSVVRVAFIDDGVDIEFIKKLNNTKVIRMVTVNNHIVHPNDYLSHGTQCVKVFLRYLKYPCELFFYKILDQESRRANIQELINAFSWCKRNNIHLINLSLGTTSFHDAPILLDEVESVCDNGIIIVAASANQKRISFPAVFKRVIGVKAMHIATKEGFTWIENSPDFLNIACHIYEEKVLYHEWEFLIGNSNSFVTPYVTAAVCHYIYEKDSSLKLIKNRLVEESISWDDELEVIQKKTHSELTIPIVAIWADEYKIETLTFLKELIKIFKNNEYLGICLFDSLDTDYRYHFFKLDLCKKHGLDLYDSILFYSDYIAPNILFYIIKNENKILEIKNLGFNFDLLIIQNEDYHKRIDMFPTESFLISDSFVSAHAEIIFSRICEVLENN